MERELASKIFIFEEYNSKENMEKDIKEYINEIKSNYPMAVVTREFYKGENVLVRACTGHKVPFIMSLCGTPHRMISGHMPKDIEEWYENLLKLSNRMTRLRYIELDPLTVTPLLRSNF